MTKINYLRSLNVAQDNKTFEELFTEMGITPTHARSMAKYLNDKEDGSVSITDLGLSFGETTIVIENTVAVVERNRPNFDINKRFEYLEKLAKMTVMGVQPSLFIAGDGGLGKTFTVEKVIEECEIDPVVVKGFSSAAGLYRLLHDNRNRLIMFDDADSVFLDKTAANLLKAATDSSDHRVVSYNAVIKEYEQSFEFTGQIIFISNLRSDKFPQALVSRSTVANMDMSTDEKLKRIETVLPYIDAKCDMDIKEFTLDFIKKNVDRITDVNFRTLIKLAKIFNQEGMDKEAENLALFVAVH